MARQHEVRYINSYVSGNVAYQMEPKTVRPKKTAKLPKLPKFSMHHKAENLVISVNPVAVAGIALAVVMLVMMTVGYFQLTAAQAEAQAMEKYVLSLQSENVQLKDTYTSGYDLAEIEQIARAMGMIPIEEAQQMQISVQLPQMSQESPEPNVWESIVTFLTGLFA